MITPGGRRIDHQPHHATIGAQVLVGIGGGWGRVVIRHRAVAPALEAEGLDVVLIGRRE